MPGRSEGGSALILVLVVTAALLIIGGALLIVTVTENRIARNQERDLQLYYLTEAGLEAGVAALSCGGSGTLGGGIGGGSYCVQIVDEPGLPEDHPYYGNIPQRLEGGRRLVISTGSLDGRSMAMAVIVEGGPPLDRDAVAGEPGEKCSDEGVVIAEWINPWRPH